MEKRRKTMCDTCIYRTGELKRNAVKHPCHEHELGGKSDSSVACAGSCKPHGMQLIETETPNRKSWARCGDEIINSAIARMILKGRGVQRMSSAVRTKFIRKQITRGQNV